MSGFHTRQGELWCDDVQVAAIARAAGTPVHVYSGAAIDTRYRALDAAFSGRRHRIHYAIKANATIAVVRRLRDLGAGADANSAGEIEVARRAGFRADEIVFTGVGKTPAELAWAVGLDLAAINAESPGEMGRIADLALAQGKQARVAVRVNPDIDAGSHPHISTGLSATKFGVSIDDAAAMIREMARRPSLKVVGLHVHVGSQITKPEPLARAAEAAAGLARSLAAEGIALEHLDLGGGLGIAYQPGQTVVSVEAYARALLSATEGVGLTLMLEPGRWIVGPAGILVAEVVDLKLQPGGRWFVVSDAGMTDLLRPALYGAWHNIEPVAPRHGTPIRADIVGPVCETSDTLGHDRELAPVEVGDFIAVRDTGAYGAVMASNYNRRLTAAEVMVDGSAWRVVRRRQTVDDLLQWDE